MASPQTNAVHLYVKRLAPPLLSARLRRERLRRAERLALRYELDLVGFLNGADEHELLALCGALGLKAGRAGLMRQRLWSFGAAHERRALGIDEPGSRVQPPAVLEHGRLRVGRAAGSDRMSDVVLPSARAARFPECAQWPRAVPAAPPREPCVPVAEPTAVEELLARADALIGVRLGRRGRDKGAYGQRVADLLGLPRSSEAAPDWRGEVEVKTLAVVRARGGHWRIKDGPALSMRSVDVRAKLHRVLWIVRVDEGEVSDAPILSWYFQELDRSLAHAFERARHLRPKGGKGTTARGWYLRRGFFESSGLLRSLNGP